MFLTVAAQFYIPTNKVQGSKFSHLCQHYLFSDDGDDDGDDACHPTVK